MISNLQLSESRVALFIDGESLHQSVTALGCRPDFRKFHNLFSSQCRLLRAYYYALVPPGDFVAIKPLLDWLTFNGFTVREKHLKARTNRDGHERLSGSFAIDLTIDVLQATPHVDAVVLVAGDACYRPLVSEVQMRGVRVIALSSRAVKPSVISDDLVRQVDEFVELSDLLPQISMSRPPRAVSNTG